MIDRYTHAHCLETFEMFLRPDREYLDNYRSLVPPKEGWYVFRALRTKEGKMIGNLALYDVPGEGRWEIAYDLDPDYWGRGLGGMMVGFLVNWAGVIGVKVISAVRSFSLFVSPRDLSYHVVQH